MRWKLGHGGALALFVTGCTLNTGGVSDFGRPSTTVGVGAGESEGSSSGTSDGSTSTAAGTTASDSTEAGEQSTGAAPSTTSGGAGESTDGTPVDVSTGSDPDTPAAQPDSGLWADCHGDNLAVCDPGAPCVSVLDPDTQVEQTAFCSLDCTDDGPCDPVDGATASPSCRQLDGLDTPICVLDCSGGESCPVPMQCYDFGQISLCA